MTNPLLSEDYGSTPAGTARIRVPLTLADGSRTAILCRNDFLGARYVQSIAHHIRGVTEVGRLEIHVQPEAAQ